MTPMGRFDPRGRIAKINTALASGNCGAAISLSRALAQENVEVPRDTPADDMHHLHLYRSARKRLLARTMAWSRHNGSPRRAMRFSEAADKCVIDYIQLRINTALVDFHRLSTLPPNATAWLKEYTELSQRIDKDRQNEVLEREKAAQETRSQEIVESVVKYAKEERLTSLSFVDYESSSALRFFKPEYYEAGITIEEEQEVTRKTMAALKENGIEAKTVIIKIDDCLKWFAESGLENTPANRDAYLGQIAKAT